MSESFSKQFITKKIKDCFTSQGLGVVSVEGLEGLVETESEQLKEFLDEIDAEISDLVELEDLDLEDYHSKEKDKLLLRWLEVKQLSVAKAKEYLEEYHKLETWNDSVGTMLVKEDLREALLERLSACPPGISLKETPQQWKDRRLKELADERAKAIQETEENLAKARPALEWAVQLEKETDFL